MTNLTVPQYSYASILKDATKITWQVDDLIGTDKPLDFTKPFLPEAIAHTRSISCLSSAEQLTLNHIRGNSYLHLFGLVEEFILPLVVGHVQSIGYDNIQATEAYLCFAEEESKHIRLFRQFAAAFNAGFGSRCDLIGPPQAIANFVLQHSPLGVALATLHIEWMTQKHFLESVRDNQHESLDPQFCSLLRHHWQEEAQHARLDALMVQDLAKTLDSGAIATAIDDYIAIIQYLNEGLKAQVLLDISSLERAVGRTLTELDRNEIQPIQERSYQQVFLRSGMTHSNFIQSMQALSATGAGRIAALANTFS
jgi:hypothetical protein